MSTIIPPAIDLLQLAPLHQFSSAEYLEMIDKGVLSPKDRVELVGGFIVNMSPQGSRHVNFLMQLNRLFAPLHARFVIAIQSTLVVAEGQVFDPDFLLLRQKPEGYKNKLPEAIDAPLLVEASETSLRFDQWIKLPAYASAGIPEYWIGNLEREVLIIHREPKAGQYDWIETRRGDEQVSPLAAPDLIFAAGEVFE